MKNYQNKKGFTLIELLVVVLIIGILSAVALPQYQKAVLKSKVAAALPRVAAMETAQKEYKMANGSYTSDLSALSIDTGIWSCNASENADQQFCQFRVVEQGNSINVVGWELWFPEKSYYRIYCIGYKNTLGDAICKEYGTLVSSASTGNNNYYLVREVH